MQWLTSAHRRFVDPVEVQQLALSADGRVVAARFVGGKVKVWSRGGDLRLEAQAPGQGLSLSPDGARLAPGDGRILELGQGGALVEEGPSGSAFFVGDTVLWAGPGPSRWGALQLELNPAPSPDLRVLPGPGGVLALLDLAWDGACVLDPQGALRRGGGGPAQAGCWAQDRLLLVQEGQLCSYSAGLRLLSREQPHGLQTLAVAEGADGPLTLGLEAQGWSLRWAGGPALPLPGRCPERPSLWVQGDRALVSLWDGLCWVSRTGALTELHLPLLRRRRRPVSASPELLPLPEGGALLGSRPPVEVASDGRFICRYE